MRQRIRFIWTCSDYVHHEHRHRWTATLCGKGQHAWHWLRYAVQMVWYWMETLRDARIR